MILDKRSRIREGFEDATLLASERETGAVNQEIQEASKS